MQGAKGHNEMHPPGGPTEKRGDICGGSEQEIAHTAPHTPPLGYLRVWNVIKLIFMSLLSVRSVYGRCVYFNIFGVYGSLGSVCVFSLHADWPLCTLTCAQCIQKPVGAISNNCICLLQHAVDVFLCGTLQFYDVWVVDHLVLVSHAALGNHERHFLNAAKEWPCHDWRNRRWRMIYIFLSLCFPAQKTAQRLWIHFLAFPNVPKRRCFWA